MNLDAAARAHVLLYAELLHEFPELADDERTFVDTLDGVSSFPEAISAVLGSIDSDEAMIDGISRRIASLTERQQRYHARVASKRAAICAAMERANEKTLVLPEATLTVKVSTPHVVVTDESLIPDDFKVWPDAPPPRPDKLTIARALKDGHAVPGCVLGNGGSQLTIRRR